MGIGVLSSGRWKVNSTPIYTPSSGVQIEHESIQSADTGRTEDGVMRIDWVRTNIVKVHLAWKYLTGQEVAFLESLMQGEEFTLTYYDKGSVRTAEVYVSNMSYRKVTDALYTAEGGLYSDITVNAIQL